MTDKEKLNAIRAEIHRLVDVRGYDRGMANDLFAFMDSLPNEPVSKDLEEACDEYYDETWDEHGGKAMVVDGCHDIWFPSQATDDFYKAGAQWQKEQIMKNAISMDVYYETEWDDIHKFLRKNLDGEKVKLLIIKEE